MKTLITLLLIITTINLSAQDFGDAFNQNMFLSFNAGISIDQGEDDFLKNNGFDVVGLYGGNVSFFELHIGSTDLDSWEGSYFKTGGSTSLKYFYPIQTGDSLGSRFSGYFYGFDMIGINFFPSTNFIDFVISAGANTGSKKVRADNDVKYKNYVFAPKVSGELRLVLNNQFGFNLHVEQQYDVTKARWKLKKGADVLPGLPGYKNNALLVSAGISWKLDL